MIPPLLADAPRLLTDLALDIDPDEVLRFQGYKRGVDVPSSEVLTLFGEALVLGRSLLEPRAVVRWAPVRRQERDRVDVDTWALHVPDVEKIWGRVEYVAPAICTIGDGLERRVAALWESHEFPLAVMLDSVGSGAVESLAEYVNDVLCQEGIAADLQVTNRISPGYGEWDVREQRILFQMCSGEPIGVALNDACFMTPVKSISLLVGAGVAAKVDHYFSQCARCWMAGCAYRRVPARRTVHQ